MGLFGRLWATALRTGPTSRADVVAKYDADAISYVCRRARELGCVASDVRGPRRYKSVVRVRKVIAEELRAAPWFMSLPEIGRALNRHHSTIHTLLNGGKTKLARLERLAAEASKP